MYALLLYESVLVSSASLAFFLAVHAWRHRAIRGNFFFFLLMVSLGAYAINVGCELASTSIAAKVFWSKLQYVSTSTVSPLWLLFALSYAHYDRWLTRRRMVALWIIPMAVLALVWTNEWHGMVWDEVRRMPDRPDRFVEYVYGPAFWVLVACSYTYMVVGSAILVIAGYRASRFYRGQMVVLITAGVIPLFGNVLYLSGYFRGFDLAPLFFALSGALLAWGITRQRLLQVNPIAYNAMLASMLDGVILIDAYERIVDINPAAEHYLGLSHNVIGQAVGEGLSAWPVLARHVEGAVEFRIEPGAGRSGTPAWYEASAGPLRGSLGQATGRLLILRDISDRKRAEEARRTLDAQMLQSQKMESLGVLAGGIAHDFNNMFMIMMGSLEVILQRPQENEDIRESLKTVYETVQRAAELSRQMLAYAGKGSVQLVQMDLSQVVRQMMPMIAVSVPDAVKVEYDLAEGLPSTAIDAAQMRQVVMNLVRNSVEAIEPGQGSILIKTGDERFSRTQFLASGMQDALAPGHYVFLEVTDTGCGMKDSDVQRVFDPFFSTKFMGRGLGLAASLGVVRCHSGTMRVSSEPDQGSSFAVILPAT